MKKVLNWLTKVENIIMIVTFAIMVVCEFLQVVNRNIFKLPITWYDELSEYCMIYMVLIGTEVGLRDGTQIAVTGVVDKLHGRWKTLIQTIAKVIVTAFAFIVFLGSLRLMNIQIRTGQISAALGVPMAIPYFAMVISFFMIALVQGIDCIQYVIRLFKPAKGGDKA